MDLLCFCLMVVYLVLWIIVCVDCLVGVVRLGLVCLMGCCDVLAG